MKTSIFIRSIAVSLFVIGAPLLCLATDQAPSDAEQAQVNAVVQQQSLERASALIAALDKEGALTIDNDGNVKIKPSVIQQLNQQGRLKIANAQAGVICQ